jgi:hypothetical protein
MKPRRNEKLWTSCGLRQVLNCPGFEALGQENGENSKYFSSPFHLHKEAAMTTLNQALRSFLFVCFDCAFLSKQPQPPYHPVRVQDDSRCYR